jgi:DNA-binding transcriptional ArsR family regulator
MKKNARDLIDRLLSSEVKADLLTLFHKNPGLIDTREAVARRVGLTPETIDSELKDLLELGVLTTQRVGNHEVFRLNKERDLQVQKTVEDQLKNLDLGLAE